MASATGGLGLRVVLAAQRAMTVLPIRFQHALGRLTGLALLRFADRRREIARRNLELCFPEMTPKQRNKLLRDHFSALGVGFADLGIAWYAGERRVRGLGDVHGIEHVAAAQTAGRGVMLVSGHFTTLDMTNRLLGRQLRYASVYRPLGNPRIDAVVHRGRARATAELFPKSNTRQALKILKNAGILWLMIDQADSSAKAVQAPFFGVAAATMTTPARLAASTGCAVLPMFMERTPGNRYSIVIEAPIAGFPSGDNANDAADLNRILESQVRRSPAQYYWIHRRFKSEHDNPYDG